MRHRRDAHTLRGVTACSGSVLIVDDDGVNRQALEQALRAAGLETVAVGSGAEALAWLAHHTPSLVLLDPVMPPPSGYDVLSALRGNPATADVPTVVLTSLDSDEDVARAFEAGADDYVRKPFRAGELVARIRGQLRLRSYIEALGRKERDAKVVLELTQALASSLDLDEILTTVVQRVADVTGAERCSIVLAQDSAEHRHVVVTSDECLLEDVLLEFDRSPQVQEALASGQPLIIEDATAHPLLEIMGDEPEAGPAPSLAVVPIRFEHRPMGLLCLQTRGPVVLGEHELSLACTLANATAIALRNAHLIKSLRDRTERVSFARFKAERRLRLLKRYAAFFESGADGIVVTDLHWKVLFSNAQARTITGYSEELLRGRRFDELLAPPDRALMQTLRESFARGERAQNDVRLMRLDGSEVVLSVSFSAALHDDSLLLLSLRDVTYERAVEAELNKTKDFLERVIHNSVNAIISVDQDGTVRLFNRAAQRCTGFCADQVIGKLTVSELFDDVARDQVMALLKHPSRSSPARVEDLRTYVSSACQERIPISLSAGLTHEHDRSMGAVVVFTDLRDRLRMEARLAAAQEQLESRERQALIAELAGAAAHELNQPLTSVMGYAELLKRKLQPDCEPAVAAQIILNEAERMAEIVRKIGKITRYETKSYVGAAKILDLDRACAEDPSSGRRQQESSK